MSTIAPEANFKFWAIEIPKNSEKSLDLKNDNFVYHVSNATLGQGVNRGRTTVFCKANGEKAAICNLVHSTIENASLDLIVSRSMNASFIVKGPNAVTVSGYIQPLVEDSDSEIGLEEDKTVNEKVAPEIKAPEKVASETKASEKVASETKAPESQDKEKKAVPIEKETKSEKRKIEEVEQEQAKAENTQQKKRNKTNNLNLVATEGVDNKCAKSEDPPKTTKVEAKPKVAKKLTGQSIPRGDKANKGYKKFGKGVRYRILKKGHVGVNPTKKGDSITLLYIGCLKDGTQFDKDLKAGLTFKVGKGEVIGGMEIGVKGMFPGEKRRIIIPSDQGYGKDGVDGKIPPNSELHFTVQRK